MKFGDFIVYETHGKILLGRVGITVKNKIKIIPEEKNRHLVSRKMKNVALLDKLIKKRDRINEKKSS